MVACLVAAAGLAFWGVCARYGFVWDDQFFIQNNRALLGLENLPRHFYDPSTAAASDMARQFPLFRPLRNLSWMLDYQLAGLHPGWWHLHNVLIHTANAWLVGLLAWMLVKRRDVQIAASLVFLLHPVVSEAVCWVKCRDDLLSTAFALLAAVLWLRWRREPFSWPRSVAVGLVALAACLSKEQAVVVPVLLGAVELVARREGGPGQGGLLRRLLPTLAAVATVLVWRWMVIGRAGQCDWLGGSALRTWMTMVPAFAEYARLLVVPHPLLADYAGFQTVTGLADPSLLKGCIVLAAATAVAGVVAWRIPESRLGLAWAVVSLAPVSNAVPMMQYLAERFLYLPMAGVALVAGVLFGRLRERAAVPAVVAAVLLFACYGWLDIQRRGVWRDEVTLFRATVSDAPGVLRPRRNLATALFREGLHAEALPLTRDTWRMSRERPGETPGKKLEDSVNYAAALMVNGREEEGRAFLEEVLKDHPDAGWPHLHLGVYHGRRGNMAEALSHFEKARSVLPDDPEILNNLGMALRDTGRMAEAEKAFSDAVSRPGAGRGPYLNLAATFWKRGAMREAAAVYRKMLERWPDDPEATHWLLEAERNLPGG